jgi:alkanesulfonate monooxygenase SsuD/methylene tetrahydromethanopterin reductase-like flavin-dependent oxidoreductase (luciferase family)
MKVGAFLMPNHPPGRDFAEGHYHNLDYLEFLDRAGFHEAWIGEHYTAPREPLPSPDLLIAQALLRTERIKLCPGAFLLPYHHPAELAHRIAWLDHIARGRCMIGIGAGGLPSDWEMFNVDGMAGENRAMTEESLAIMQRLWTAEEPFVHEGRYWTVRRPAPQADGNLACHIRPFTRPHPPIGIAGLTPMSPTLRYAGRNGFIPLSLCLSSAYLAGHWAAFEAGAAEAGLVPDRGRWRVGRDIYVADTDEEAFNRTVHGAMGDSYRNYLLPLFKGFGLLGACKHDPDVPDGDVTVEYMAEHCWIIGSPHTVERKLGEMLETSGGFGCLLAISYDHLEDMSGWRESKLALAQEIAPKFATM